MEFFSSLLEGETAAKYVSIFIAIQVFLFGLGEALTRISVYTDNHWDNKLAEKISSLAWMLGLVISKFGYSVPKCVIEEKAKELSEKKGD